MQLIRHPHAGKSLVLSVSHLTSMWWWNEYQLLWRWWMQCYSCSFKMHLLCQNKSIINNVVHYRYCGS